MFVLAFDPLPGLCSFSSKGQFAKTISHPIIIPPHTTKTSTHTLQGGDGRRQVLQQVDADPRLVLLAEVPILVVVHEQEDGRHPRHLTRQERRDDEDEGPAVAVAEPRRAEEGDGDELGADLGLEDGDVDHLADEEEEA